MAPAIVIEVRDETIRAIQQDGEEKVNCLIADIEQAHDQMVSLLKNYEREKDHKGQVFRFHPIKTLTINPDGRGHVTLHFPVNIFNGCKGLDADLEDRVQVRIVIDLENKTALLTGDERMPEREPDDC
jgi:hypothetical protein